MTKIPHDANCRCRPNPDSWWINSPEHHNCFWTYLKFNTRSHTLQECAILMNISISAIVSIEHKALKKLGKRGNLQIFEK